MHDSVLRFVRTSTRDLGPGIDVLDVGSFDVNGSARVVFDGLEHTYLGVDMVEGPGVDIVCDAHELDTVLDGRQFDVVLCLEMLEHDSAPWATAAQLARACRPGGSIIITARGNGFPLHNEPDCFRFMEAGLRAVLEAGGLQVLRIQPDPQVSGWFANCTVGADLPTVKPARKRGARKAADGE